VLVEYEALVVAVALVAFTGNANWCKITIFVWLRGSPFVSYTTASGFDQQWTSETQHRRRLEPADNGTKRFPCNRLKSFIGFFGMLNIYREKQHILSILRIFGLLNLKGCNEDIPHSSNGSFGVLADFDIAFWIFCLLAWIWMRGERVELAAPLEPDTEPKTTTNPHINFEQ
jgi:hypothetical protein